MVETQQKTLPFMKMHGLGNDFVVVDGRDDSNIMTSNLAKALADRHRGVGFDQLAVIETDHAADLRLTFYNADGSLAGACGNATRCIAQHEMNRVDAKSMTIRTERGVLQARDAGGGLTSINMGAPLTVWHDIPLAKACDTLNLPIDGTPTANNMGNPHCTFFVEDAELVDLASFGPLHEHHPLFPNRTNVQVAQVLSPTHIRMRVWERGTGITLASGSSSCATAIAAVRRGLTDRSVTISCDGGDLQIDWRDDGVWMSGPTMHAFNGSLTAQFIAGL